MMCVLIIFGLFVSFVYTETRMIPMNNENTYHVSEPTEESPIDERYETTDEKVIGLSTYEERQKEREKEIESEEPVYDPVKKIYTSNSKKPCAIVVLSNIQNANMQSLLRKYRYDANGILIPSSVQYFIKLPQGLRSSPLLVPLTDKAFSPLGGFVRYYKEVPPIPQSW